MPGATLLLLFSGPTYVAPASTIANVGDVMPRPESPILGSID